PRLRLARRLLLRHGSILVSKVRNLQQTQGDSLPRPGPPMRVDPTERKPMTSYTIVSAIIITP
ncbi:hypothetical protein, partial [Cellulosimicrobium composti]|uniref:hypothetical protein n=1 Tax=Cellulosimicrobium composti TaxID=2672572 RepID=UPI0037AEF78F